MDEGSRSSSPDAPPQDLWLSILDSVSSSRSIPAKNVLVLGQPSTGKSTLVSALLQKPAVDSNNDEPRVDFALGYDWADIRDEGEEDILTRLSVYTVPSSAPSYTALVSHFLSPLSALTHTAVVIVLDWTRPWTFLEELHTWLTWIERWVQADGAHELQVLREEHRERWQAHLQHYSEPSIEPLPTTSSAFQGTILPLGPGTFTHNVAGVPIIVVCTKADLIDDNSDLVGVGASGMGGIVKGKGDEWEERTDGVMQILRTVCLKYGAALFYTTPGPTTLNILRQYTLHVLFVPPAPAPDGALDGVAAPARNPFPFLHKPNTLDRDRIVVPAGWDSWGKIAVLRDGFDAKAWGEAWEYDLSSESGASGRSEGGARKQYAVLVPDQGLKPTPLPQFNNPTPEQAFLAKNYDENTRRADRDPRGMFRSPVDTSAPPTAGLVGPLGSTSFSLPTVERALAEMEGGSTGTTLGVGMGFSKRAGAPTSPIIGSAPSPTGQTQHEVLQNFFKSLLNTKDRGAGPSSSAVSPGATAGKAPPTGPRTSGGGGGQADVGSGADDG
ncbi:dynein light intermediate chain-domain-containing protein [Russula earlei]|uniref:Dynein light intermediate chain-domain-containing protein n=1 Tax=Russula earlei TaxID=71964 RepID=A0ACC0U122_9AGAM|nr:dynein light intermediate chain-domain-containing protein [Russula earlei]